MNIFFRSGSFFLLLPFFLLLFLTVSALKPSPTPIVSGKIVGKITYDGQVPKHNPISMADFPDCATKHTGTVYTDELIVGKDKGLANVFVRLVKPSRKSFKPGNQTHVMEFKGCMVKPHIMGVMVNQPLSFKNSDGILHNVHGLPKVNKSFNIGMPPNITQKRVSFASPEGPFQVKCDVHPWMTAYVAVMTHPYFGVTGPNGGIQINTDGLLSGVYKIEAWHERLGKRTGMVKVEEGTSQMRLNFGG